MVGMVKVADVADRGSTGPPSAFPWGAMFCEKLAVRTFGSDADSIHQDGVRQTPGRYWRTRRTAARRDRACAPRSAPPVPRHPSLSGRPSGSEPPPWGAKWCRTCRRSWRAGWGPRQAGACAVPRPPARTSPAHPRTPTVMVREKNVGLAEPFQMRNGGRTAAGRGAGRARAAAHPGAGKEAAFADGTSAG